MTVGMSGLARTATRSLHRAERNAVLPPASKTRITLALHPGHACSIDRKRLSAGLLTSTSACLTEAAMMRPLFEQLTEDHERLDEWSAPLGFVFGGMATYAEVSERDEQLAEQYRVAAEALVDAILEQRVVDHQLANPVLFLYRHCWELLLKAGLPSDVRASKNVHDLPTLAKSYAAHYRQRAGHDVPTWIMQRCEELASIDAGSTAFRYGECGAMLEGEVHVDLVHLKAAMKTLSAVLVEQNRLIRA